MHKLIRSHVETGSVTERFMVHAWKACVALKPPQVQILSLPPFWLVGRVRLMAPVSKTGGRKSPVGSNPTLTANL